MRRSVVGLLSLAMAGVTGLLLATSEFSLYNVFEWFGVSFENVAVGTKLAAGTGVTTVDGVRSGTWTVPTAANTSAIVEENGVRYLYIYSPGLGATGPTFDTTTAAFAGAGDGYRIDCSTMFPVTDVLPALPTDVKSAMALSACDGALSFYGYGANGWVRLSDTELEVSTAICYDQRAEFRCINGVLYVTYSIKNGSEYVELKDDYGNILIPAAAQGTVRKVEFRGIANMKSLTGSKLKSSVDATAAGPEGYPMSLIDWFSVLMAGVDVGTALKEDTGVINESGLWEYPYSGFGAEVAEEDGARYLRVEQESSGITGPRFTAKRASAEDRSEIEFSMRFTRNGSVLDTSLASSTKAAMTMADDDDGTSFYGYRKGGWQKLAAEGVEAKYQVWYDLMAAFENESGVLYVTYYVKDYYGYHKMVDEKGESRFVTAGSSKSPVQYSEVLGDTDVRFMTGTDMTFNPANSFYWIGEQPSPGKPFGRWDDGGNWSHSPGGEACNDYPKAGDSAIIYSQAAGIEIEGSDANVSNLIVNTELTLVCDRSLSLVIWGGTYGAGSVVLDGGSLRAGAAKELSLGCNIRIDNERSEYSSRIVNYNDGERAYQLKLTGKLTGDGTVTFTEGRSTNGVDVANGGGVRLLGDTSEFAGIARFVYENPRAKVAFESANSSDNRASTWSFFEEGTVPSAGTGNADTGLPQFPFKDSGRTYSFGAIFGTIPSFRDAESAKLVRDIVLEVGGVVTNSSLEGDWMNPDAGRTVRSVGAEGTVFNYNVRNTTLIEIAGDGALRIASEKALPWTISFVDRGGSLMFAPGVDASGVIHDSVAPICLDDEGNDSTLESVLDASNIGGLVKLGAGTMRLTKIPRYTGVTRVEEGVLIIPWGTPLGQLEIADGARLQVDLTGISAADRLVFAAASSEGGLKKKIEFINIPEGYVLPDPLWTDGGGVIYSTDTHIYTWTGEADNGDFWSTPGNWRVNGVKADKTPSDYDIVVVPKSFKRNLVVDIPATVWSITCEAGVKPFRFTSPAITNSTYATDDTSVLTTGSGELPGMSGVGGFKTTGSIVFDIGAGETNRFIGPMSAVEFVKRGEGEAVVAGDNVFNAITLEGGLLRLGNHADIDNLRMDFDAGDKSSFAYVDNELDAWKSQVGDYVFKFDDGEHAVETTDYFDGTTAFFLRPDGAKGYSRYRLETTNEVGLTRSIFLLYHAVAVNDGACLYGGEANGTQALKIRGGGENHFWNVFPIISTVGIYTGVDPVSPVIEDGNDYLTSWIGAGMGDLSSGKSEYLGTCWDGSIGFRGAVAEVVGFSRDLTHAERLAVQRGLMMKWGLSADYEVLPRCAAMTMADGAALDLGGHLQTVASFTGAGVVSNGVLATVNKVITEEGGALTIPAVSGTTYYLMKRQAELVLTGGKDAAVTVVVPDGCTSGRVFFEGLVDWKVTDPGITIQGPESGWYTIVNTGGGSCIIVR